MTVDERLEYLLKVQESHEADLSRLFELHAQTEMSLGRFLSRTDETLNSMARILEHHEHRLSVHEGGTR